MMHTVALTGWLVLGRLLIYDPYESIGENPQKARGAITRNLHKGWVGLAARTSLQRVWSISRACPSRYKRSQKMKITI